MTGAVEGKVLVEGVNRVKKHQRPNPVKGQTGGIIDKEAPLHVSNVAHVDPKSGKALVMKDKRINAKHVRDIESAGLKHISVPEDYLVVRVLAKNIVDSETGEIIASANDELMKLSKDPNQWVMPAGNYANTRYSELNQINKDNAKNLRPLWTFSTGVLRGHEGGPLVIGDVMYIHTPFPNNVFALDQLF